MRSTIIAWTRTPHKITGCIFSAQIWSGVTMDQTIVITKEYQRQGVKEDGVIVIIVEMKGQSRVTFGKYLPSSLSTMYHK